VIFIVIFIVNSMIQITKNIRKRDKRGWRGKRMALGTLGAMFRPFLVYMMHGGYRLVYLVQRLTDCHGCSSGSQSGGSRTW